MKAIPAKHLIAHLGEIIKYLNFKPKHYVSKFIRQRKAGDKRSVQTDSCDINIKNIPLIPWKILLKLKTVFLYDFCVWKKSSAAIQPELGDVNGADMMNEDIRGQWYGQFKDKQTGVDNEATSRRLLIP